MSTQARPYQLIDLLSNRGFIMMWAGQMVATMCMSMSEFSVSIWVYQHNQSVLQYCAAIVFAIIPALLVTPWAGSVADRSDKRKVMLLANGGGALCAATLATLAYLGHLALWHIFAINAVTSVCQTFHRVAYLTSASQLVSKEQLGGANGMIQLAFSLAQLGSPVLAGLLLSHISLSGVLRVEALGIGFASCMLVWVHIPLSPKAATAEAQASASTWRECMEALRYLRGQAGLLLITVYATLENFFLGMAMILTMPMLLAAHSESTSGMVMSFCGAGMIMGSMLMMAWGGPNRLIAGILVVDLLFGGMIAVLGTMTWVPLLCACIFVAAACSPVISSCTVTLMQRSTPESMQGRVLALTSMLSVCSVPAAAIVGGILADNYFEPAMMAGGSLAASAGLLVGVGKGRGIGLMFVLAGSTVFVLATVALRFVVSNRQFDTVVGEPALSP